MTFLKKAAALLFILAFSATAAGAAYDGGAIRCVDTSEKVVALTFDDGPHPTLTAEILEVLEKYGVRATFFVVGENARYYPDALRMAVSRGHEIGNHTLSHGALSKKSADEIKAEIAAAEDEILSACGVKTKLFRPPEGCVSKSVVRAAKELGYEIILWSVDTRDWAHCSTADMVRNIKKNVRPGSVVLFHDYISGAAHTKAALNVVIPYLLAQGYRFVTVSELINA